MAGERLDGLHKRALWNSDPQPADSNADPVLYLRIPDQPESRKSVRYPERQETPERGAAS